MFDAFAKNKAFQDLLRATVLEVLRSPEGQVSLDFRGKLPGRGAYVCPNPACLAKAKKSKALERAFSAPLPEEVYQALEEQMKEVPQDAQ